MNKTQKAIVVESCLKCPCFDHGDADCALMNLLNTDRSKTPHYYMPEKYNTIHSLCPLKKFALTVNLAENTVDQK